ncbi:lysine transporter LysE [Actibacterium mucosum KCTC 23349]|uniref:Lysine transporter LysE n=1 Tax=Actibacterium mucosum KCTC 23349 TaxID=1454373 RepID=A0A037ZGI0_9RHOB|nr:LysE family translocator [Actibacterium mucosum]KAJ54723.1 lysine transporter LysE [Actibacterium mucosum KCTC 23349]
MDLITPYLTYVIALAIAAVIPGPGVAALVGQSLGGQMRSAVFFTAGMALGDVTYLTVAIIGLAAVVQTFAGAFVVIKILGAVYLIYLGIQFWAAGTNSTAIDAGSGRRGFRALLAAYLVTLGNPKTVVFYLALLPTVLQFETIGVAQWAVLTVLTIVVLFATMLPYALLANRTRALMTRPRALRRLNRIAGATIGGAGALVLGQAATAALRRA